EQLLSDASAMEVGAAVAVLEHVAVARHQEPELFMLAARQAMRTLEPRGPAFWTTAVRLLGLCGRGGFEASSEVMEQLALL
ncbi:unnamed protein product, partial [Symbiodinium natans]